MIVTIVFDEEKDKPIVCLEAESENEYGNLELLASFNTASFRLILDETEEGVAS